MLRRGGLFLGGAEVVVVGGLAVSEFWESTTGVFADFLGVVGRDAGSIRGVAGLAMEFAPGSKSVWGF